MLEQLSFNLQTEIDSLHATINSRNSQAEKEGLMARFMYRNPGQAQLINEWIKKTGIEGLRKEDREIFEAVEAWKKQPFTSPNQSLRRRR